MRCRAITLPGNEVIEWVAYVWNWHKCDLRAAPTNVRSWERNGLNAEVAIGPFMTQLCHGRLNHSASQLTVGPHFAGRNFLF
jgi:hypothetical protein